MNAQTNNNIGRVSIMFWRRIIPILVVILATSIVDKHGTSASPKKSYQASFSNSSDVKGIFPYIQLAGAIPISLSRLTLCYWARPTLNETETIFSYAVQGSENSDNEIWSGINPQYGVFFTHRSLSYEVTAFISVPLDKWMHVCVTWSAINGLVHIYVDGSLEKSATGIGQGIPVAAGGVLVLGQDQDSIEGGFQATQAWKGDISEVQLWDDHLTADDIFDLFKCKFDQDGNIISWKEVKMKVYAGVQLGPVNLPCSLN